MLKRWLHSAWVGLLLVCTPMAAMADEAQKEYLVKAAFIYNFVKFVEWPGGLAVAQHPALNICVIGDNAFGAAGQEFFARASTPALRLTLVEKKSWSGSAEGCHVAFISRSEQDRLGEIMAVLKTKPILTVSEIEGFATKGGIIGFTTQDNKIKLIVNAATASAAGLRIDAQLLEIALQVIRN